MSGETDKEQKTEEASERRRQELRKEGRVAQSHELVHIASLCGTVAAIFELGEELVTSLEQTAMRALRLVDVGRQSEAMSNLTNAFEKLAPVLLVGAGSALVTGLVQTRGLFSLSLAFPKAERLDPSVHLGRLFSPKEAFVETGLNSLKFAAVGFVLFQCLRSEMPGLVSLTNVGSRAAAQVIARLAGKVLMFGSAALLLLAVINYVHVRRRYSAETKMTREELKEEHKQEEQDPQVKRQMRMRARELMKQRSLGDVSKATVLLTNPTHYAVALRYEPGKDGAPVVVAKAQDAGALRMRKRARSHAVPIVENRPLARALHKHCKIGAPIPSDLYVAVAEVIAHVLRIKPGART